MSNLTERVLFAVVIMFVAFCLFMMGSNFASKALMDEAVRTGHAEYYLDENQERQWRFLPPPLTSQH